MMPKATRSVNAHSLEVLRSSLRVACFVIDLLQLPDRRQLLGAMAGDPRIPELAQRRDFDAAALDGVRTALVEGATRRRVQRRRRLSFQRDPLPPACTPI